MSKLIRTTATWLALLATAPVLQAAGSIDPSQFPECESATAVIAGEFQARSAFGFRLPDGAALQPTGPSLDHEFVEWRWPDGRRVQYQFGFAVTDISGWVDDAGVTGCRLQLDGVAAALLQRIEAGQPHRFAIGLFDFVQTYHGQYQFFSGEGTPVSDDLVLFGEGADASIFTTAREIAASFRWSKLPQAASGPYSVDGAANNGVFANWDLAAATVFFATFTRDTQIPDWIAGSAAMPTANARAVIEGQGWLAQPLRLLRVPAGGYPGTTRGFGDVDFIGYAELQVRDDCSAVRLVLTRDSTEPLRLPLSRILAPVLSCDRFAR